MSNLTPFDSERAKIAAAKSVEARRAKRARDRATTSDLADSLATLRDTFERDNLGENAAAVGNWVLGRVALGKVPIRHAGDAADLLRVLVDVARLEAGEATSVALVGHVSDRGEVAARVAAMQQRAREALASAANVLDVPSVDASSAAAVAVADPLPCERDE